MEVFVMLRITSQDAIRNIPIGTSEDHTNRNHYGLMNQREVFVVFMLFCVDYNEKQQTFGEI
jgi:hypothetical protein